MKPDVLIISPDTPHESAFSHMLSLELAEDGITSQVVTPSAFRSNSGEIRISAAVMLVSGRDADELAPYTEVRRSFPLLLYGDKFPEYPLPKDITFLHRPFLTGDFIENVRRLLSANKKLTARNAKRDSGIFINTASKTVSCDGVSVTLTQREYELLEYLYLNRGRPVSREEAITKVWEYGYTGETNVVDVYIRYLRAKLDERFDTKLIVTVRGEGYMLKDANWKRHSGNLNGEND